MEHTNLSIKVPRNKQCPWNALGCYEKSVTSRAAVSKRKNQKQKEAVITPNYYLTGYWVSQIGATNAVSRINSEPLSNPGQTGSSDSRVYVE
ncbi:hypothetical protein CHS0354_004703 [Potamilus streckersoni]|uniref:Uncharacterized protein n=1 Tax=Potamilus streckersoni TaxID=2493646 RepID=A0AAE0T1N3_9BIVA|nr:hypothetical protein CHS0354_004703 [Potamilus streckersoni]